MKYMGGKAALLQAGLGAVLTSQVPKNRRFIDLFTGSGAVANFVASRFDLQVSAVDLQSYSYFLTNSILGRISPIDLGHASASWIDVAVSRFNDDNRRKRWSRFDAISSEVDVQQARMSVDRWSQPSDKLLRSYGGYYFSPNQALAIQHLYDTVPPFVHSEAIASLIMVASRCAASPGHTAQPFNPRGGLIRHINLAWRQNPFSIARERLAIICRRHALRVGLAVIGDAREQVLNASEGDLVFVDPPYTDIQYSRLYHVLEGVARGGFDEVGGAGRAPARALRPTSLLSSRVKAVLELHTIIDLALDAGAEVMLTLPENRTSTGVSGQALVSRYLGHKRSVSVSKLAAVHSTLGGGASSRMGRRQLNELVVHIGATRP